ncbi:MAG TPA: Holliday junction resolvase RuvX [Candidatus Limnocylindrales bacterium]|nr:Holliday junction resolvase RuvX [Candidatus Limnocylindrales bacterium]
MRPPARLLGVDLGERRIGLAVADLDDGTGHTGARSLAVLRRGSLEQDVTRIARLVDEQGVTGLVVGLPRNMDGSEGAQAAATREWAAQVAARLALPLAWRDERLTSEAAEASLPRTRRGRAGGPPSAAARGRRRAAVDREAARLILQAELDARSGAGS